MDYSCSKWKKKRKRILRLDKYKCQVMSMYGLTTDANIVHHIYPAKDYPEYRYEDWNLISVSGKGHNKLENRTTGELTKLGKDLMNRTIPYVDWRDKKYATR